MRRKNLLHRIKTSGLLKAETAIPLLAIFILGICCLPACKKTEEWKEPVSYVDPFIGTDAHGHTYPGATVPFGMVQLSPQSRLGGWDGASGYHYTDSTLFGFAHTALSGTGVGDYGDILIIPQVGDYAWINEEYLSPFRKESEHAEAGYYRVHLDKPNVKVELTATTRVGYHRYTFPKSDAAHILIDLEHRDRVLESQLEILNEREARGMRRSTNWARDMVWYFHLEFSKPFKSSVIALNNEEIDGLSLGEGKNVKALFSFDTDENEVIEVKVSLSAVDAEGALANLKEELPSWGFDSVRERARDTWIQTLGRIKVTGGTEAKKRAFYTALYHSYLQPNTFMDVDGRYRGIDRQIHAYPGFTNYTVFSLWDTYRAWHPLMTILEQERSIDFIRVMLDMYEKGGLLPIWELAGNETYTMIGNHAISAIVDAHMKGIGGFDASKALEAMLHSVNQDREGLEHYRHYGYLPGDKEHESISKTLEYAYNDWCVALMARDLGRPQVFDEFMQRAQYYKNIFDPSTGFMRPKLNGGWLTPFDPTTVDWHFTEANSWQYSFYVPHDVSGLAALHGGFERMAALLDEMFSTESQVTGRDMKDITGLIGQYAHGNEPSHHAAYLYAYLDQPWKTQAMVRRIMDELYTDNPDGLSGNEDCGQMSAWLIMSAMGMYPVAPGMPEYVIGSPWFDSIEITLENGNVFRVIAENQSDKNVYIQSATWNGTDYSKAYFSHFDLMNGGELRFKMGSTPNKNWGVGEGNRAQSAVEGAALVPVPVFTSREKRIRDSVMVEISTVTPGYEVYFTLDGSEPRNTSTRYEAPFALDQTATVRAVSYRDGAYSFVSEAEFYKIDLSRSVQIINSYNRNYHGGGDDALIDGIRGATNWRLGGWQGYQGKDFEAIIDLGSKQAINYLGAGFIQDIRSWIWMPTALEFWVSDDGNTYKQALKLSHDIGIDDYDLHQPDLGKAVSTSGRYVKVKATNFGTIPQWHLGAGGQAFIFVDEVFIR